MILLYLFKSSGGFAEWMDSIGRVASGRVFACCLHSRLVSLNVVNTGSVQPSGKYGLQEGAAYRQTDKLTYRFNGPWVEFSENNKD